jgi:ATP-dependent Lon protease
VSRILRPTFPDDPRSSWHALPLRDEVLLPGAVLSMFVGRPRSLATIDAELEWAERAGVVARLFLTMQKDPELVEPREVDLHPIGTIGEIVAVRPGPVGSRRLLIDGWRRARLARIIPDPGPALHVELDALPFAVPSAALDVLAETLRARVRQTIDPEVAELLLVNVRDEHLAFKVATAQVDAPFSADHLLSAAARQALLEVDDPAAHLQMVSDALEQPRRG